MFESLLQAISQEEYQAFIRRYALKNKKFKADFELYFADKDDRVEVGKRYKELIRQLIRVYSDHGYVSYRDTFALSREINKLLRTGRDYFLKNDFRDAFAVSSMVLVAMMKVMDATDDSEANIGETLYNAVELINDIATAEGAATELKEQVFAFLQKELHNPRYFDGDSGNDLFDIFQALAIQLHQADAVLSFIHAQLPKLTSEYDRYQKEFFRTREIELLKATGKTEAAENLAWENLDIVAVRQGEIDKALARQDYAAAKALIAEGIRVAETLDHSGTVETWHKELLRLAVLEKDTATIRHYASHFAFDRGFNQEPYRQWKSTFSKQEWTEVIEKLIAKRVEKITKLRDSPGEAYWSPRAPLQELGSIYIEEHYWDRLLALVQQENDLQTIAGYHKYLVPHYPAELLDTYLSAFGQYGQQASGRDQYAQLANEMKRVMKAIPAGKEQILDLAHRLKEQFRRRPAMVEELNKMLS